MLKVSYSLLNCWKRGDKDEAIKLYLRIPNIQTEAMKMGSDFDTYVKKTVSEKNCLPDEIGGKSLSPSAVAAMRIDNCKYADDIYLSGEMDVFNGEEVIEVKCGIGMDSAEYLSTGQLQFYFLAANILNLGVKCGRIYHYNWHYNNYDTSFAWNTKSVVAPIKEMLDKYIPEIKSYFTQEGILI